LIRQISRGIYQLAIQELPGIPDLISVVLRLPKAVICLISALHYYGITMQIPHKGYIALPQPAEKPRLGYPLACHSWCGLGVDSCPHTLF
jgi:predicted transcriptional regulator of viral defense system